MMNRLLTAPKDQIATWMRMGMSPRRLALTLALGFAIGCLPVVGIPTAICAIVAMTLRLNVPVIQAANYAAMPLQLMLMLPFVRLGGWMFASGQQQSLERTLLHGSPVQMLWASGNAASHAMGAWLVFAGPMVVLLTLGLTPVLQRVPALARTRGESSGR
ncbi:MAG TPA: DUF2062 domain-containing protein [Terracidiphilus sp.]|jgi:uncharacterized protein (DUF2062 family)|nr:DUF2062 domain-containing protein [Terracidiphilus sp.]